MTLTELKSKIEKAIAFKKEIYNYSDEEMESNAIRLYKHQIKSADEWGYGKASFRAFEKFVKETGLTLAELEAAEGEGLFLCFAPTMSGLGKIYFDLFVKETLPEVMKDVLFNSVDYENVGKYFHRNLNKIFKSAVYKKGVGLVILDPDEMDAVFEQTEVARNALNKLVPKVSEN